MSQVNVERVIGLLATDESFRRRFAEDARAALASVAVRGIDLTAGELEALVALNPRLLVRFAKGIDPRLQKCDLKRGLH